MEQRKARTISARGKFQLQKIEWNHQFHPHLIRPEIEKGRYRHQLNNTAEVRNRRVEVKRTPKNRASQSLPEREIWLMKLSVVTIRMKLLSLLTIRMKLPSVLAIRMKLAVAGDFNHKFKLPNQRRIIHHQDHQNRAWLSTVVRSTVDRTCQISSVTW